MCGRNQSSSVAIPGSISKRIEIYTVIHLCNFRRIDNLVRILKINLDNRFGLLVKVFDIKKALNSSRAFMLSEISMFVI